MATIRLISRDNGAGLSRDMRVLEGLLVAVGHTVRTLGVRQGSAMRYLHETGLRLQRPWAEAVELQIFIERVYPRLLPLAGRNLLIPNPEWFLPQWQASLPGFKAVLCKTHEAQVIFASLGCATDYIGFISDDRHMPGIAREATFFHLAGRSSAKGTAAVLDAWLRHPEWPRLTVVQSPRKASAVSAPNIDMQARYVDDDELRRMQNRHLFHLCPSEVEGFGHYLAEAMSVGAVVITTDGAPMNELIQPGRGLLVAPVSQRSENLATRYTVDVAGIERAVAGALAMTPAQRAQTGEAARRFFLEMGAGFQQRLIQVVDAKLSAGRDPAASSSR